MNYRTRDKLDFALFCTWFFCGGFAYLNVRVWWAGLNPTDRVWVILIVLGTVFFALDFIGSFNCVRGAMC